MNKQLIYMLLTLIATSVAGVGVAQEVEDKQNQIKWGFRVTQNIEELTQGGKSENIRTDMQGVMLLGAFIQNEKASLSVNGGYSYIDAEMTYKFYRNWMAVAGGSFGLHSLEVEKFNLNTYYSYVEGDVNVSQYYLGAGYHNVFWKRLKLNVNAKIGGVHTQSAEIISLVYSDYHYYGSNKKARGINRYELSPSLIYGGNLYLELLPRESKNRKTPLVPFFNLNIMGNTNRNVSREVIVEEWVPGNVVYHEKVDNAKYSLNTLQVQFGVKWYMKY